MTDMRRGPKDLLIGIAVGLGIMLLVWLVI